MKKIASLFIAIIIIFTFAACSNINEIDSVSKKLTTYNIVADFNDELKEITATQTINYVNNEELPLKELCFHLYANAFRKDAKIKPITSQSQQKVYPYGPSYGEINIRSAKAGGKDAAFTIGGEDFDILIIPIAELYPGEKLTVEIEFLLKLPKAHHRMGYGTKSVNLGNWFPILSVFENGEYRNTPYYSNGDPFYSDISNYNVTFTVPQAYVVAFTGNAKNTETNGGKTTYSIEAKAVRDFALVLSKDFKVIETQTEDVKIMYYYYNDDESDKSLQIAKESIETFNRLFGKYPHDVLSVVETHFMSGGMEYPTLVYISDAYKGDVYREIIVHEIAHQWWYSVVGNDQVRHAWLDEGLTEYSTVLFYENNPQYNLTREKMIESSKNSYKLFLDVYAQIIGTSDSSMNRAVNEYKTEYEYVYITYVKGELMFDALRSSIGAEKFYKGLKRYYNDNKFKHATPANLITSLERGSGIKVEDFLNSWIEGNVIV